MYSVPNFNSFEQLSQALDHVFREEPLSEEHKNFLIKNLMSDQIKKKSKQIRTFRQFAKLVHDFNRKRIQPIFAYLRMAKKMIAVRGGVFKEYSQDLLDSLEHMLLSQEGDEYLHMKHNSSYRYQGIDWWLQNEVLRLSKGFCSRVKVKDAQHPKKQKSTYVQQLVTENKMTPVQDDEGNEADSIIDSEADRQVIDGLRELELNEAKQQLITLLPELSPKERSSLIARHWNEFCECADKKSLAENVISPLSLPERIKVLDATMNDQQRMVNVTFPDVTDEKERKYKLSKLNRASNRAKASLQALHKKKFG